MLDLAIGRAAPRLVGKRSVRAETPITTTRLWNIETTSIAHFAAGAFLLILGPLKVGDVISAGGTLGTVREIGLFGTTIVTPEDYACRRTRAFQRWILLGPLALVRRLSTNTYEHREGAALIWA